MSRAVSRTMLAGFLASLLGLGAGVAAGVPEGKALAGRLFTMRASAIRYELSSFAAIQFQHADSEHAREAALTEIRTVEALTRLSPQLSTDSHHEFAQALLVAYARLALIEDAAGRSGEAQAARARAQQQWSSLHPGAPLTLEQMKQSVREVDSSATLR